MATEGIVNVFFDFIISMVSYIPIISVPIELLNGIGAVTELLIKSRFWIPWPTVLVCVGWLLALYNVKFLVAIANWVIKRIPVVG